jgi:hypothetical protein
MNILAVFTTAVFLALSVLHVYWALGGRRGTDVWEDNGDRHIFSEPSSAADGPVFVGFSEYKVPRARG